MLIPPTLVDSTFLSADECSYVYNRLIHLRDKWVSVRDTDVSDLGNPDYTKHCFNFLGVPVYSFHNNIEKYIEFKNQHNDLLSDDFGNIYVRIKDKISQVLGFDAFYCDDIAYPGFHIFGPGMSDQPVNYDYFHFHRDHFSTDFMSIIPYTETFSFIIPIKLPKNGGSLTYGNKSTVANEVLSKDEVIDCQTYEYTEGSMSYWSGNIPHKISDFVLDGVDDYRITWQIHVAVCEKIGVIFW